MGGILMQVKDFLNNPDRDEVAKQLKIFEESNRFTNPKLWDRAK